MKINEVEQLVGITKRNIRFYEKEGLLAPGRDSQNGYRDYSQDDVEQLRKIKLLRKLAFPLDQIRSVQAGEASLGEGVRDHIAALEHERRNLEHMQAVCTLLIEGAELYPTLDAGRYLRRIEELEQEGTEFMNIKKRDARRKFVAPVAAACVTIALMLYMIGFFIWALTADADNAPPIALMVLFFAIPAIVIVGMVFALRQRIRELKGGEEDAASQY